MIHDLQAAANGLAYIKPEPGLERGLTYQVSPDIDHFPSLVWKDPVVFIFCPTLTRAGDNFGLYGFCELASPAWLDVARVAEETEDRLRLADGAPADIFAEGSELLHLLRSTGGRRRLVNALQLTSFWLRDAISRFPALTFYGV
jgi:hypothetical protein